MAGEIRQIKFQRAAGSTELLLIRHGESEAAVPGENFAMVDGQGDPALHAEGRAQAERVAERLQHEDISAIYVTTLRRTAETAAPLAARLGLEPIVEADLREVFLGEWEGGVFRKHIIEQHPIAVQMYQEQRWDVIPGAEPADVFAARIERGITRIADRHRGECVAVFSHGAAIGQVLAHASGSRPFAFNGSDNGAISQLIVEDNRWVIRRYNDTAHLSPLLSTRPEPLT
jgi:2,3-bisphosphoglycerate-dependent phosphoglycerate mutase